MPCPHPYGLKVPSPDGDCYACLKQRATNGSRAKLSVDQLLFVGFDPELELEEQDEPVTRRAWLQPINPSNIDQRLTELAEARDIAPGWYALARRILEDEKVNRK